jgi:hypothetical protein
MPPRPGFTLTAHSEWPLAADPANPLHVLTRPARAEPGLGNLISFRVSFALSLRGAAPVLGSPLVCELKSRESSRGQNEPRGVCST